MAKKRANNKPTSLVNGIRPIAAGHGGEKSRPQASDYEKAKMHTSVLKRALFRLQDCWTWYSGEFAFSMLEPWEVILLHIILIAFLGFLYFACTQYLPAHIRFIVSRAQYYLFGNKDGISGLYGRESFDRVDL